MAQAKEEQKVNSEENIPASEGGQKKKNIPAGLWTKCPECTTVVFNKTLKENFSVCTKCDYHFVIGIEDRIESLLDEASYKEFDRDMAPMDPLQFKGVKSYKDKIIQDQKKTGLKSACSIGEGTILGKRVAFGATDSRFIMGSMGSVVGEKITRIIEYATQKKLPLVIVSGSGGGARMYEGMFSLMQMAKTCAALSKYRKTCMPFISVLTNPTMGGVMASFSSIGDINIAEPRALLGFAGPRVIEQTIKQKLPDNFQTSEFLQEKGMIDMVVSRAELPETIRKLIEFLSKK